jgi:hypothetical protein
MENYPEPIKRIQKFFNVPDKAIVKMKTGTVEPRGCDSCGATLVDEKGMVIQTSYLTDYGLVCADCIGNIRCIVYPEGKNVSYEYWYKGELE